MSQLNKAGDLAWSGLVALALAKRDGIVQSASQENLFLTRWLATALKQRRFPRSVTPDIEWLLGQGRTYGMKARLPEKLDYPEPDSRRLNGAMQKQIDSTCLFVLANILWLVSVTSLHSVTALSIWPAE